MFEQLSKRMANATHPFGLALPGRPPARLYAAGHPLVLAHRGARTLRAENTLGAFLLGMAQGAHGVELDVHLTKDRQVVVFHDEDLGRLGRPSLHVANMTLAELQSHDVGALVKGGAPEHGIKAPSLLEVLEALPSHAIINVELKGESTVPDGLEVEVLRTVARARAEERVLYSSFNPLRCIRLRRMAPDAVVGMLHETQSRAHLRDLWWLPLVAPHALHPERVMVDAAYMAHAKALHLAVHVWTVNEPEEMLRLAALGVDAIITDVPDLALATLRSGGNTHGHEPG